MAGQRGQAGDFKSYREAFDMFDRNNDSHISVYELGIVMRSLGRNPTVGDIEDIIHQVDTNDNGTIEFNEFKGLMDHFDEKHPNPEDELMRAFRVFDADGNGKISADELKKMLRKRGDKLTEEEMNDVMNNADINEDGFIDYEEFVRMMHGNSVF
ncbi:neo-calmodulin-like [Tubulanus polymorphus]|uniref:neo-calmodulin-like n=1 Tax=Tubulanus polymorphus TaxID=672921 RepID=UPI003DA491B6